MRMYAGHGDSVRGRLRVRLLSTRAATPGLDCGGAGRQILRKAVCGGEYLDVAGRASLLKNRSDRVNSVLVRKLEKDAQIADSEVAVIQVLDILGIHAYGGRALLCGHQSSRTLERIRCRHAVLKESVGHEGIGIA
jgi:hypothetical protein